MPNYYAHLSLGAQVLSQLPQELSLLLNRERSAFDLGCLGPDPLFFYRPTLPNPVRREGVAMHARSALPVFGRLREAVEENLEMGAYTRPGSEVAPGLETVYEQFPRLKERRRQVAGTLSGGEQQMLAMGRALMSRPKLMMLDEPSLGLAPLIVNDIMSIIRQINGEGISVLLVEQNARKALSIAHHACVLEQGRIVKTGTGAELAADESIVAAYLGKTKKR